LKSGGENQTGMTLIEVMLAVAILGLGLVMMLTAISRCLGVLKISQQYHKAMWALSAGEAKYPLLRKPDMKPDDLAVPADDLDDIRYERTVADPDKDADGAAIRLLVVTTKLSWQGRGREQTETIPRYVIFRE